jgi:hypothetical protein
MPMVIYNPQSAEVISDDEWQCIALFFASNKLSIVIFYVHPDFPVDQTRLFAAAPCSTSSMLSSHFSRKT